MTNIYQKIQNAIQFIRTKTDFEPQVGVILGTGLGNLTDEIETIQTIDYKDIPHFPTSTVQSHKGQLIFGYLGGQAIVAMAGRFHFYEGYTMKQVTFPVRVMKFLGIQTIIISNVSGSTNAAINAGDIVLIKDHINLQPENPLRGENDERLGIRFPDMLKTYSRKMIDQAKHIANKHEIKVHEGVYIGLQGPNLETPAEYNMLHIMGGDVVGMSTVPEVLVAKHSGLEVFVISVVSNQCYPIETITETTVEAVIALAEKAEPKMRLIVTELLRVLD